MNNPLRAGMPYAGLVSLALVFWPVPEPVLAQSPSNSPNLGFQPVPLEAGRGMALPPSNSNPFQAGGPALQAGLLVTRQLALSPSDITDEHLHGESQRRAVLAREMDEGIGAPGLVRDLRELGEYYQERGDHARAIRMLEKARHASRVNHGLYAEEQIVLVEKIADSLTAVGRYSEAEEQLHSLLDLSRGVYGADDSRTVPVLEKLGHWHLARFHRTLLRDRPEADPAQEDKERAYQRTRQAEEVLTTAINLLLEAGDYRNPRLLELERALVQTYYLRAHGRQLLDDPDALPDMRHPGLATGKPDLDRRVEIRSGFQGGEQAYQRMLSYLEQNPTASPAQYADVRLGLGDWYFLFGRKAEAREQYRLAWQLQPDAAPRPDNLLRRSPRAFVANLVPALR